MKAYVKRNNGYVRTTVTVPSVIHNRTFFSNKHQIRLLSSFLRRGRLLFNRRNRYGKLQIHRLLWQNANLRPHMPTTNRATAASILRMMRQYDSLIVKPDSSSVGRGIMRIDRTKAGWKLTYPVSLSSLKQKWRSIEWKGGHLH
ncbi:YheC/YheD family protein, partial [Paenibacillus sp. Soil522]|uniref:YheC/YheD family protein n=1 Tax=Paenibacillus sp. Soil522 TaxID=1736388 RepID=UPI002E0FFD12